MFVQPTVVSGYYLCGDSRDAGHQRFTNRVNLSLMQYPGHPALKYKASIYIFGYRCFMNRRESEFPYFLVAILVFNVPQNAISIYQILNKQTITPY